MCDGECGNGVVEVCKELRGVDVGRCVVRFDLHRLVVMRKDHLRVGPQGFQRVAEIVVSNVVVRLKSDAPLQHGNRLFELPERMEQIGDVDVQRGAVRIDIHRDRVMVRCLLIVAKQVSTCPGRLSRLEVRGLCFQNGDAQPQRSPVAAGVICRPHFLH